MNWIKADKNLTLDKKKQYLILWDNDFYVIKWEEYFFDPCWVTDIDDMTIDKIEYYCELDYPRGYEAPKPLPPITIRSNNTDVSIDKEEK